MNTVRSIIAALGSTAALALLSGCGGKGIAPISGGGAGSGGGSTPTPSPLANPTAHFHVDVATGKVTVTRFDSAQRTSGKKTPAIFRGSAVGFNSSLLVDQAGNVGRKVLNVSLTNNSGEPMGNMTGLKVIFGPIANDTAFSDLRNTTTVSTFAGTGTSSSTDGPVSSATFYRPTGVAVGPDGAVYVADSVTNKIRRIKNGVVTTIAGNGVAGFRDGAGTYAEFNQPAGLAVDSSGYVFVCDTYNNRIRRISPSGVVITVAGTGTAGEANGTGDVATFYHPQGITLDGNGNGYVTEDGDDVRVINTLWYYNNSASSFGVSTLAGISGTPGFADGPGGSAKFSSPRGIVWDSNSSSLFVCDYSNNRIRRVSNTGEVITIAGSGSATDSNGAGNKAGISGPIGISKLGSALFVTEINGKEVRILQPIQGTDSNTTTGWNVATLAGTGAAGSANGSGASATFNTPYFVAVDPSSNLYLADYTGNRIRKVVSNTGHFPTGVITGSTSTEAVQLANPTGVIPSSGLGVDQPYIFYQYGVAPNDGTPSQAWQFVVPSGVTAFEFDVEVEADTDYTAPPEVGTNAGSPNVDVRTVAGGVLGFVNGVGAEARMGNIKGIAVAANGTAYFADSTNDVIDQITPDGTVTTIVGVPGSAGSADGNVTQARFNNPNQVACTPDGSTLFVSDFGNNEIRMIQNLEGWNTTTIAGSTTAGKSDGIGAAAGFDGPAGITLSPGGVLYVTEQVGNRVRRVQKVNNGWLTTTLAGDNTAVAGASGLTNSTGTAARFNQPFGVACDRSGIVWVADSGNEVIRKITVDGSVSTFAGSATAAYADGLGTAAEFNGPVGIAVDDSGYLYVADFSDNHIRRIAPSGQVNTVAGTGAAAVTNGAGNTCAFNEPIGIAATTNGDLYVTDFKNGTIRLVQRVLTGQ